MNSPIGVFDSGVGGLNVARAIRQFLPNESIIYYGDSANLPYGSKSQEQVLRYSIANCEFLIRHGVKMIVVACNTATAFALDELTNHFSLPIVGVIAPAVERAEAVTISNRVAVIGTVGTINSKAYDQAFSGDVALYTQACPDFVTLVEEGLHAHAETERLVARDLVQLRLFNPDTLILGCTHFPALAPFIRKTLGDDVTIIDSAQPVAAHVASLLKKMGLEADPCSLPQDEHFFSGAPVA